MWGKHPKPERGRVKPCGGCGLCREALQTQLGTWWRKQPAKAGTGQPAAGKSEEKHCRRTLAGQGLPFFPKTGITLCVCRYVTPRHLISPCQGRANELCGSVAGADATAAAHLRAGAGGRLLPEHARAPFRCTTCSYLSLCPPEFGPHVFILCP